MHPKIRGKVEISSAPYNAMGVWKCAPYYRKGDEIISHFELRKLKILSIEFGILGRFAPQRIECSEARGTARDKLKDLESLG